MAVNAPFYVMNEKDELVPAKFLVGPDGQYITNPNLGYAVYSRTYYILGFSFWRSEADKLAKSPRRQSFSHEREVRC
jgi:hypothetical protein